MPRISSFYGIVITMYFDDHAPPHFHARRGEYEAQVSIHGAAVLQGHLPRRARQLVRRWAALREHELAANWDRARMGYTLVSIDPLP